MGIPLLYTITGYVPSVGGAQHYLNGIVSRLSANNHDIRVVCHWTENRTDWLKGTTIHGPKIAKNFLSGDVNVRQLGYSDEIRRKMMPWVALYYFWQSPAIEYISNQIADLIKSTEQPARLVHNIRMGREGISVASLKLARQWEVPFVFSPLHHPKWQGWFYRRYIQLYREADAINALTHYEKRVLMDFGVDEKRIFVTGIGPLMPDGPSDISVIARYEIQQPYVLFIGQMYKYKHFEAVLASSAKVWQTIPELRFVFAGPSTPYAEKVFGKVDDPRIIYAGKVTDEQQRTLLANCLMLCVPSEQESFGGVYLEAWNYEKPVIGGPAPAVQEVISDGKDGFYITDIDPDNLANKILILAQDQSLCDEMGKNGKEKIKTIYNWDTVIARTEAMYDKLLAQ